MKPMAEAATTAAFFSCGFVKAVLAADFLLRLSPVLFVMAIATTALLVKFVGTVPDPFLHVAPVVMR
jgi:hypothetical protein